MIQWSLWEERAKVLFPQKRNQKLAKWPRGFNTKETEHLLIKWLELA